MRIVQEKVDRENYLELCVTPDEIDFLKETLIISKKCYIAGEITNVGIKLELHVDIDEEM